MTKAIPLAIVLLAATLAGCESATLDCTAPQSQQQKQECAHRASTEPRGPDTLPANPKKW
ncbi:hypothetical protein [Pseudomonas turukhanskensis]|uniref:Entry exclusion lipoprotein TrbK n=1 Tax=Pseudomonas turukhanskensis TaxID=1806536 RepID=A0A9W6KB05_9PSED|nr:hypothetical protein [Pseudomonas turukhanskensis]GLK90935.1 hypothetical protein GCM10017655_39990 [Pseudomonas turukhanskensis]